MIPEIINFPFPGNLPSDRKGRVLRALDVLLGNDLAENRLESLQAQLNAMAREMNKLHDRLNQQTKLVREIREMVENDP